MTTLGMTPHEAVRVRESADPTTAPERLLALAHDPSVTVRASLAMNPALPRYVSDMLHADADMRVRQIIGRKLAVLTKGLSDADRATVQTRTIDRLTQTIAEAGLQVRVRLAETLHDIPDGPRQIILRLAQDHEIMVAEPIILCSPMLSEGDLVALIASGVPAASVSAVARRPDLTHAVSDALVGSADVAAIGALLRNPSAQIREATLDVLAIQAEEYPDWHEPLVHRPNLPPRTARILSEIVSGHLLAALGARDDIAADIRGKVLAAMARSRTLPDGPPMAARETYGDLAPAAALARAAALQASGRLDEAAILDALRRGALTLASAILSVKADVSIHVIERARTLRNAKGLVSLAWRAGVSMQTAVALQAVLARLRPAAIIKPSRGGDFPLTATEMRTELDLLGVSEAGLRAWIPRRLQRSEAEAEA
jgi:uncharacterized protein (DUF2336 family)